jgi:hypothetical protein
MRGCWSHYSRLARAARCSATHLARPRHQGDTSVAAERDSLVRREARCDENGGSVLCGDRYEPWNNATGEESMVNDAVQRGALLRVGCEDLLH